MSLDQGQGGGAAIEDAAAIAAVLPLGTTPDDIRERLKLYEQIRFERAHVIQEYSRQAGQDPSKGKPDINSMYREWLISCVRLIRWM